MREPAELDEIEQLGNPFGDLGLRPPARPEAEGYVVVHRHVLERGKAILIRAILLLDLFPFVH